MYNDDLKRFYPQNAKPEQKEDFVRYDKNKRIQVADPVNPTDAVNLKTLSQATGETNLQYSSFTQNATAFPNVDLWQVDSQTDGVALGDVQTDEDGISSMNVVLYQNGQVSLTARNTNDSNKVVYNDVKIDDNQIHLTSEIKTDNTKQELIITPTSTTLNDSNILTEATGVKSNQGTENVGKMLGIGDDGIVIPVEGGTPSNMVTTDTDQTITGVKTFDSTVANTNIGCAVKGIIVSAGTYPLMIGTCYNQQGQAQDDVILIGRTASINAGTGSKYICIGRSSTRNLPSTLNAKCIFIGAQNSDQFPQYRIAIGFDSSITANNAIQLGKGTNNTANTFQVFDYQMLNANGKIPNERLNTSATVIGTSDSYSISAGGTYICLGDLTALTITATDNVVITVLGTLGSVTLPETSATVLIHATGYSGTLDSRPAALADGSVLGKYHIGIVDLT